MKFSRFPIGFPSEIKELFRQSATGAID